MPNKRECWPSNFALNTETTATGIHFLRSAAGQPVQGNPCNVADFRISSPVPELVSMNAKPNALRSLLAGLIITLLQVVVSVLLIAPDYPLSLRYDTLIQHDSYWFANIVDRGYGTTVPPPDRQLMEVSNVAFFPAYPAFAAIVQKCLPLTTYQALLDHCATGCLGVLELFLPLLRSLENFTDSPTYGSSRDCCASDRVFPGGRLFRVAFHDGLVRVHVLEQLDESRREVPGDAAWVRHVSHANRRGTVCDVSGYPRDCQEWLGWRSGNPHVATALWVGRCDFNWSNDGCDQFFRLLSFSLGTVGHVYADAACGVGYRA